MDMAIMKRNFTQIPNAIITNKNLPDGAFRTYTLLKSFKYGSGSVFPSQMTLAKIRGKSKRTIINHLKTLRSNKLITYKKRGFSASNQYFISEENYTNGETNSEIGYISKVTKTSPLLLQKVQPNNIKTKNTKSNNMDKKEATRKGLEKILRENPWLKTKNK